MEGRGYLEHAWGNWSYQHPSQTLSNFRKTVSTYARLTTWWFSHHKPHIPQCLRLTTENNPFGYDWIWGISDNNWSMFYGNSLFWVSEGPSFGALYVTPDGKQYWEFGNVWFKYNKLLYVKEYDIYYPCDLELTGKHKDKTIHLRFWSTTESYVYIYPHAKSRLHKAFVLCELPGRMEGVFQDGKKTVLLQGECKMVPLRQAPVIGHNSVVFRFLGPPDGVGVSLEVDSHFLRKQFTVDLHLAPRPVFHWNLHRIDLTKL
jgi:hypothetical protein